MKKRLIALALLTLLLAGCSGSVTITPTPKTGSLGGYVSILKDTVPRTAGEQAEILVHSTSQPPSTDYTPLYKATVEAWDWQGYVGAVQTASNGRFDYTSVHAGTVELKISHPDLREPFTASTWVYAGQSNMVNWEKLRGGVGYYLIIGVEDYPNGLKSNGAENNAHLVNDVLVRNNDLPRTVKLLTNGEATRSAIRYWLDVAVNEATENDYLVIYFSGKADSDFYNDAIFPYDAFDNWGLVDEKVIADGDLKNWVEDFPGTDVTLIIDADMSGSFIDGSTSFAPLDVSSSAFKDLYGFNVITSTRADENAGYDSINDRGVFTGHLINGLQLSRVPADLNNDGEVTAQELYSYIKYEIFGQSPQNSLSEPNAVVFRY